MSKLEMSRYMKFDKQNKVIRKYLPLAHTLHAGIPEKSFSVGDDQSVLYFSHFDNQVYRILPDTIRTFFEFDFGSLAYPQDLLGRPMAEVMHVMTEEDHLSVDKMPWKIVNMCIFLLSRQGNIINIIICCIIRIPVKYFAKGWKGLPGNMSYLGGQKL